MSQKNQPRKAGSERKRFAVSALESDWKRIQDAARREGISTSKFVLGILEQYLDPDMESPEKKWAENEKEDLKNLIEAVEKEIKVTKREIYSATKGELKPYTIYGNPFKAEIEILNGTEQLLSRAISLLATCTEEDLSGEDDTIRISLLSEEDFETLPSQLFEQYQKALRDVLSRGWDIAHILRFGTGETHRPIRLIEGMLSFVGLKGSYSPLYLPPGEANLGVACDFLITPKGALLRLLDPADKYSDLAFFSSDHIYIQLVNRYFTTLWFSAESLLRVYRDHSPTILDYQVLSNNELLLQDSLSVATIPLTVMENLIERIRAELPTDVPQEYECSYFDLWLYHHENRVKYFQRKLKETRVIRHINSKEGIKKFVETGWCSDYNHIMTDDFYEIWSHREQLVSEKIQEKGGIPQEDRIKCLRHVIGQLQKHQNYELALVDQTDQKWSILSDWDVEGTETVLLDYPLVDQKLCIIIDEPSVVNAVHNHFDEVWGSLPSENKDKEQVIKWLENLITRLENRNS